MLKKICTLIFASALVLYAHAQNQAQSAANQPAGQSSAGQSAGQSTGQPAGPAEDQPVQEDTVDVTLKIFKWAYSNAMTIPNIGGGVSTVRASKDQNIDLWYKSGDSYRILKVSSGNMSGSIHYKGPQTMVFYTREESLSDDGPKYNYREACRMTIPLGIDELFAMMFKTGKTVMFYPINVSPKLLPKEKIAVINMTSHRVALMVGGEPKLLRSGGNAIFNPKHKKETSVELKIARMVQKKWKPVYQNNISVPKDARCVVLLYDPSNKASPKFNIQVLSL